MNKADVKSGIRSSWALISDLRLSETISTLEPLEVNISFRDAALDTNTIYEDVYLIGLKHSHYNFLLDDYSYFQFSFSERDHVRYAFYPNPFIGSQSDIPLGDLRDYLEEGAISSEEYLHRVSELRSGQVPPVIRYENAPSQYVEVSHPCSHFHLGHHGENRWPLSRVLKPLAFTMMIVKQFYGATWRASSNIDAETEVNRLDERAEEVRLQCATLPEGLFSAREQRQFHFS